MKNKQFILLGLICIVSLLSFLGSTDFNTKGEPREAIVAYSMIESGNWILPINNGDDIAYKPPFFHWSIAALSSISGKVTEYTSRMPSALALIAMVLGGFVFFAKRRGVTLAFLMGLITLTNFEVHRAGVNCRVDMVLTAFIVLALYQLYRWTERKEKGFPFIATLLMGGATLTKGPVGIILPCLVIGVYLLLRGRKFHRAFFSLALIAIVSCIIPAIWYISAYRMGGDNFVSLMMEENFGRFMGKMSYQSHENPAYYNIITLIVGYAPYTLLLLISLFTLKYKKITGKPQEWWNKLTSYIRNMDDTRLFSLLSIVIIFVFYCIPKSKRSVYLLPIYPFIAYFIAEYLTYLVRKGSKAIKIYGCILSVVAIAVLGVFVSVRLGMVPESIFHGKHAIENIAYMNSLKDVSLNIIQFIIIGLPLLGVVYIFRTLHEKKNKMNVLYAVLFMTFAIYMSLDAVYQPTILNTKSDKNIANKIREIASGQKIYSHVESDMLRFYTINFYHNDQIKAFEAQHPEDGYLLVGKNDFINFHTKYDSTYTFKEVYQSKFRGCDIRDIIYLYQFQKKNEQTHSN